MNKKIIGSLSRGVDAFSRGEFGSAIAALLPIADLNLDANRYLGLAYAAVDDADNALETFIRGFDRGDIKSLPWLVFLIEDLKPDHPRAKEFAVKLAHEESSDNPEILLGLGNIQMYAHDNPEGALQIWQRAGMDNWLCMKNLILAVSQRPEFAQYLVKAGEVVPSGWAEVRALVNSFYWKFVREGIEESAPEFFVFLSMKDMTGEELQETHKELAPYIWRAATSTEPAALDAYLTLVLSGFQGEHSRDEISQLYADYGLEDHEKSLTDGFAELNKMGLPSKFISSHSSNPFTQKDLEHFYVDADAASEAGDAIKTLEIWRDLENAGDQNGMHNFAAKINDELGVTVNYFGVEGDTSNPWAGLAVGIIQSENRPPRTNVALLDAFPGTTSVSKAKSARRVIEILDWMFLIHNIVDDAYIAMPYTSESGMQLICIEFGDVDGAESIFVSSTLGIRTTEGQETFEVSRATRRVLDTLFRQAELILPGTSFMDIGHNFNIVPTELQPSPFISLTKETSLRSFQHYPMTNGSYSEDKTLQPILNMRAGYGIPVEATGNHFEVCLSAAFQNLISVFSDFDGLFDASKETFDLIFSETPINRIIEQDFLDMDDLKNRTDEPAALTHLIHLFAENNKTECVKLVQALAELGEPQFMALQMETFYVQQDAQGAVHWAERIKVTGFSHPRFGGMLNNLAWLLLKEGDKSKGDEYMKWAAQEGSPNAMSSVTWYLLQDGEHQQAREFFDRYYFKIMTSLVPENGFEQAANMRSNDALNRWALGASKEELLEIWENEKFQEGHTESAFYPIFMEWLEGNTEEAIVKLEALPSSCLRELRETFDGKINFDGWFADISKKAFEFLKTIEPKKKGLFHR